MARPPGVVVGEGDVGGGRPGRPQVASGRAERGRGHDDVDLRELGTDGGDRPVRGLVVDDDDGRALGEAAQLGHGTDQLGTAVPGGDDDRHRGHAARLPGPPPDQPSSVAVSDHRSPGSSRGIDATQQLAPAARQVPPEGSAPPWLTDSILRLEGDARLDAAADRLSSVADAVLSTPERRNALRGTWFGHALHPVLTDFPLGPE